jgi:hypothetical protein
MRPRKATSHSPATTPSVAKNPVCGSAPGLAGIDGLKAGDPVTAEQMQALFGVGLHPLAVQRQQQLQGLDLTSRDYLAVTRLGAP